MREELLKVEDEVMGLLEFLMRIQWWSIVGFGGGW